MYQDVVIGKRIEDWTLEELARGRPYVDGKPMLGPTPKWMSPQVQMEVKRRLLDEIYGMLGEHLHLSVKVMADLLKSEELDDKGRPIVDPKTKFAAASFIIEHFTGKPKALVDIKVETAPQNAIAAAIVLDDGQPQDNMVVDGEIVEDEEEEEEVEDDDFR